MGVPLVLVMGWVCESDPGVFRQDRIIPRFHARHSWERTRCPSWRRNNPSFAVYARRSDCKGGTLVTFAALAREGKTSKPACKPGSVPRPTPRWGGRGDGHLSSLPIARQVERPTRES